MRPGLALLVLALVGAGCAGGGWRGHAKIEYAGTGDAALSVYEASGSFSVFVPELGNITVDAHDDLNWSPPMSLGPNGTLEALDEKMRVVDGTVREYPYSSVEMTLAPPTLSGGIDIVVPLGQGPVATECRIMEFSLEDRWPEAPEVQKVELRSWKQACSLPLDASKWTVAEIALVVQCGLAGDNPEDGPSMRGGDPCPPGSRAV